MKKLSILAVLALTACGTIFNGSSQDMSFDSNVKGVEIFINGMKACSTPCIYPIDRSSSTVVVSAKKAGYEEQQTMVKSSLSAVAVLNLTFWPSWLTDVATGGMWKYNRDGIYIDMEKTAKNVAELDKISKDVKTRRFSLMTYNELKNEASQKQSGEYISTLSQISGLNTDNLINIINNSYGEVELAHNLTGIK